HPPPTPSPFPYTTLFRSTQAQAAVASWHKAHTEAQAALASGRKAYTEAQAALASWRKAHTEAQAAVASGHAPRQGLLLDRAAARSEEHTSELQSLAYLVC